MFPPVLLRVAKPKGIHTDRHILFLSQRILDFSDPKLNYDFLGGYTTRDIATAFSFSKPESNRNTKKPTKI